MSDEKDKSFNDKQIEAYWNASVAVNSSAASINFISSDQMTEWRFDPNSTVLQGGSIVASSIYCPSMKISYPNQLYVVKYTTESGDEGIAGLFAEHPSEEHLRALAERDFPAEIVDDEMYISFIVTPIQVTPLPQIK